MFIVYPNYVLVFCWLSYNLRKNLATVQTFYPRRFESRPGHPTAFTISMHHLSSTRNSVWYVKVIWRFWFVALILCGVDVLMMAPSVTVVRLGDKCSLLTDCEVLQYKVACTNSKCACSDAAYEPHSSKIVCIKKSLSAIGGSCEHTGDCSGV